MNFEGKGIHGSPVESNYEALLKLPEWANRRRELLVNPTSSCELCNKSDNGIEVHHKYYIRNRSPWEYPDNCFMILCSSCHKAYHKLKDVPVYNDIGSEYCSKYAFDDISFASDYYTGTWGLEILKQNKRVAFILFGDEQGIWLTDAKKTIGQLIYGLNLSVIKFPSVPGRIYKKQFSNDHIEWYIEGWSEDKFLSVQFNNGDRLPKLESDELAKIDFGDFVKEEIIWYGVTSTLVKETVTGRIGFFVSKTITDGVMKLKAGGDLLNPVRQDEYFIPIGQNRKSARYDKCSYDVSSYLARTGSHHYDENDIILIAD